MWILPYGKNHGQTLIVGRQHTPNITCDLGYIQIAQSLLKYLLSWEQTWQSILREGSKQAQGSQIPLLLFEATGAPPRQMSLRLLKPD